MKLKENRLVKMVVTVLDVKAAFRQVAKLQLWSLCKAACETVREFRRRGLIDV